jgi:NADPH-dependent ferric siderophore reductase
VIERADLTPQFVQLVVDGAGLVGFAPSGPAAAFRLLMPRDGHGSELELPVWDGNAYFYSDGARPPIRTVTPLAVDAAIGRLTMWLVRHGDGLLSEWAEAVEVGSELAISGPTSGYEFDPETKRLVVLGDASATPAIVDLLRQRPGRLPITVIIEDVAEASVLLGLDKSDDVTLTQCSAEDDGAGTALIAVAAAFDWRDGDRIWAAGEAAAMQRLRTLFADVGIPRPHTNVRGYWKAGRALPG